MSVVLRNPQPLKARESSSDHQSSVVVTEIDRSGDLVLRGGRLNSALVAASNGRRRVDGRLGLSSKVTASRRLVFRVGTSIGLDSSVLDVVGVGTGSKGKKRSTRAHAPVLALNGHTVMNMLVTSMRLVEKLTWLSCTSRTRCWRRRSRDWKSNQPCGPGWHTRTQQSGTDGRQQSAA